MSDLSSNDVSNSQLNKSNYKPIVVAIVVFIALLSIIFITFTKTGESFSLYLKTLLQITSVIFILGSLLSVLIYFLLYNSFSSTLISSIFNIFIVILTLSLLYKLFKIKSGDKYNSLIDLASTAIFYIPCLFIKLIEYLKYEYNISTKTEWLILGIELLVIGMRIILPYLYNLYNSWFGTDGDVIEAGPIYLNKEHIFGIIKNKDIQSYQISQNSGKKSKPDNYNYAISTWIWINPQPPSTSSAYNTSTSLFNYGNVLQINFVKNNIEILASTTKEGESTEPLVKIYNTKNFNYQKWNSIILNYNGGTLDVFINNDLVASSINITPIMYNNKITTGSNNGIHGGIKDIVYYDKVLSRNDINSIYNKG